MIRTQRGFALLLAMLFAFSISALILLYQRMAWDAARLVQEETQQQRLRDHAHAKLLRMIKLNKPQSRGAFNEKLAQLPCTRLRNSPKTYSTLAVYKTQIPIDSGRKRCLTAVWLVPDKDEHTKACDPQHIRELTARFRSLLEHDCRLNMASYYGTNPLK